MAAIRCLFKVVILVLGIGFVSCSRNPVTNNWEFMLFSQQSELEIGQQYDEQMKAMFGIYHDAEIQSFIDERGKQMGAISHRPYLNYQFRILDSPVINAFAVPGGYIYFTRGLLAHLNSEAELIGVLGHEMGHITARHALARQSQNKVARLLLIGGALVSDEIAQFANIASLGLELVFLQYSRNDEREADRLGVEYSAKIGYDASRFADFFQLLVQMNLEDQSGGIPTFLSTHPDPGNRYESVNQAADQWKQQLGSEEWKINRESYLRMINGMVYGDNPRDGYVENHVFYHPSRRLFFRIPNGWQMHKSLGQVKFMPNDGSAMLLFVPVEGSNLRNAAMENLSQMGLEATEGGSITINGRPALAFEHQATNANTQNSEPMTIRSVFVDFFGSYYAVHGIASASRFDAMRSEFENSMNSFQQLTDPNHLNRAPRRIRIARVPQTTSLERALLSLGVGSDQIAKIALLNNMDLAETVQRGEMLKILGR
ncbi:MAG TPA: peptidase M48 [Bacteroidales bacterium]|nr:peptidase M48 [Bacteroidales bacterium]